jgi:hypothetical protein
MHSAVLLSFLLLIPGPATASETQCDDLEKHTDKTNKTGCVGFVGCLW